MKSYSTILFVFAILMTLTGGVSAQDGEISEVDVYKLRDAASVLLKNRSYRMTKTVERFSDRSSPATKSDTTVATHKPSFDDRDNVEPPRANHNYLKYVNDEFFAYLPKKITVYINEKKQVKFGKVPVDLYQVITRFEFSDAPGLAGQRIVERFWLNKDGTFARTEVEYSTPGENSLSRTVTVFQYYSVLKTKNSKK